METIFFVPTPTCISAVFCEIVAVFDNQKTFMLRLKLLPIFAP